jgi:L-threonylcarbamoyladenylate synthase
MNPKKINPVIAPLLKKGDIGVIPTDTIYGIVGSALERKTVLAIYRLRRRNPKKPMIILIGSINDLAQFGIVLRPSIKKRLKKIWPGSVSVVMPITRPQARKKFTYLHRGTGALAFRLPKPLWLRSLLKKTGPLVAPSANFEGKMPARTVADAKKYFSDTIDFYVDAGRLASKPSTLIAVEGDAMTVLREGAVPASMIQ